MKPPPCLRGFVSIIHQAAQLGQLLGIMSNQHVLEQTVSFFLAGWGHWFCLLLFLAFELFFKGMVPFIPVFFCIFFKSHLSSSLPWCCSDLAIHLEVLTDLPALSTSVSIWVLSLIVLKQRKTHLQWDAFHGSLAMFSYCFRLNVCQLPAT